MQIVHMSRLLVFCYQSLTGLQSGFLHLYSLPVEMFISFCIALAVQLPMNISTSNELNLELRKPKRWIPIHVTSFNVISCHLID